MVGVILGAFGAHTLAARLDAVPKGIATWSTAVLYHLLHAITMWLVAVNRCSMLAWWLFGTGIVCFSGSLYLLAALQWKWLGPVTPVGGSLFVAGWATLWIKTPRDQL